jgi:cell wall-associated NlpC family hydrolase
MRNPLYFLAFAAVLSGCGTVPAPAPVEQTAPSPPLRGAAPAVHPSHAEALLQALLALGIDYRLGGSSPQLGFDCSGLVVHVFREAYGIELPRNTDGLSGAGAPVKRAALQPGDLVFYNTQNRPFSHVGIYLGEGRFVHAPRSGAAVRVESMHSAYWLRRFDGARRIEPPVQEPLTVQAEPPS